MNTNFFTKNNTKCVLFGDCPDKLVLSAIIGVGAKEDATQAGTAHFLEHMLVAFLKNQLLDAVPECQMLATTDFWHTSYCFEYPENQENMINGISYLQDIIQGRYLKESFIDDVRSEIIEEYYYLHEDLQYRAITRFFEENDSAFKASIGTLDLIETLGFQEIRLFYDKYYQTAPMAITIVGNLKDSSITNLMKTSFSNGVVRKGWTEAKKQNTVNIQRNGIIYYEEFKLIMFVIRELNSEIQFHTMGTRVLNDLCLLVIENLMGEYFKKYWGRSVNVYCNTRRYSVDCRYICINVKILDAFEPMLNISVLHSLSSYIRKHMSNDIYKAIIKEYTELIYNSNYLISKSISKEITNNIVFGEPIFDKNDYLNHLDKITMQQVLNTIDIWCELKPYILLEI